MKLLANPIVVKIVLAFVFAASLFILGVWFMRRLRKEIEPDLSSPTPRADSAPAFTVAAFQSVIQQLKDQQQELQKMRKAAQDRASASENIAAAVFTNLDTGVVVFNRAGLAQHANPAAREILGFGTVSGMHARDLFRGISALSRSNGDAPAGIDEALQRALCDAAVFRGLDADFTTPAGEQRKLSITIAPALGSVGECYGAVCLVAQCSTAPSV